MFQVGCLVEDGMPDLGLFVLAEVDQLGVAAVLKVGDAVVAPAVLVVAQQRPARIGRQGRLARARKPQQQGNVAVRPLVGRAVQGQDALAWQHIVHHGEHQLLDAAGIGRAKDDAQPPVKVHGHGHVGGPAIGQLAQPALVPVAIQLVVGHDDQGEAPVGKDASLDVGGHRPEHVVGEQRRQRPIADHLDRQGVGRNRPPAPGR